MAPQSSVLAWESPRTEEPGGLQPTGPQSRTRLTGSAAARTHRPGCESRSRVQAGSCIWSSARAQSGSLCCSGKQASQTVENPHSCDGQVGIFAKFLLTFAPHCLWAKHRAGHSHQLLEFLPTPPPAVPLGGRNSQTPVFQTGTLSPRERNCVWVGL